MEQVHTRLIDHALVVVPPPPPRFTLCEWNLNNQYRNRICLDQERLADSIIASSDATIDEVQEKTELNKRDVNHRLEEKIKG